MSRILHGQSEELAKVAGAVQGVRGLFLEAIKERPGGCTRGASSAAGGCPGLWQP